MRDPNPPYSEPAFPRPASVHEESQMVQWAQEGMSTRDWFAGQALIALVILQERVSVTAEKFNRTPFEVVAAHAYRYADAMVEEGAK